MATRSHVHFCISGETYANVYVHYDGYPDHRLPELKDFLKDVKTKVQDTRFTDPEYLAAKFIVWYSQGGNEEPSLDFLGIGVVTSDHMDAEYIYEIHCDKFTDEGFPEITYKKA